MKHISKLKTSKGREMIVGFLFLQILHIYYLWIVDMHSGYA